MKVDLYCGKLHIVDTVGPNALGHMPHMTGQKVAYFTHKHASDRIRLYS